MFRFFVFLLVSVCVETELERIWRFAVVCGWEEKSASLVLIAQQLGGGGDVAHCTQADAMGVNVGDMVSYSKFAGTEVAIGSLTFSSR